MHYKGIELVEQDGKHWFIDEVLAATYESMGKPSQRRYRAARRRAWKKEAGVVESKAVCCLGKLTHGRQHICYRGGTPACGVYREKQLAWFDHRELFWIPASREYVLTAQPYGVSMKKIREMEAVAQAHGMVLEVSIEAAWWYPGATPLIVWRSGPGASGPVVAGR